MKMSRLKYAVPVYIIIIGFAWLLNVYHIAPKINWVLTIGIGALGVIGFFVFALNKVTVVIGSFMIIESLCLILKQAGLLDMAGQAPILFISLGCLLLLVQVLKLPTWKE
jgi:hypothetical protein